MNNKPRKEISTDANPEDFSEENPIYLDDDLILLFGAMSGIILIRSSIPATTQSQELVMEAIYEQMHDTVWGEVIARYPVVGKGRWTQNTNKIFPKKDKDKGEENPNNLFNNNAVH